MFRTRRGLLGLSQYAVDAIGRCAAIMWSHPLPAAHAQVVTAQYFVWAFGLLPLLIPRMSATSRMSALHAVPPWLLFFAAWLALAYCLEFQV